MSLLEFNFNEEAISQLEKLADATDDSWAEVLSQSLDCFCQVVEIAKKSTDGSVILQNDNGDKETIKILDKIFEESE